MPLSSHILKFNISWEGVNACDSVCSSFALRFCLSVSLFAFSFSPVLRVLYLFSSFYTFSWYIFFLQDIRFILFPIGLLISAVFLSATLAARCILPANHHILHWRCQTFYVTCLLIGDLLLAFTQLVGRNVNGYACISVGTYSIWTIPRVSAFFHVCVSVYVSHTCEIITIEFFALKREKERESERTCVNMLLCCTMWWVAHRSHRNFWMDRFLPTFPSVLHVFNAAPVENVSEIERPKRKREKSTRNSALFTLISYAHHTTRLVVLVCSLQRPNGANSLCSRIWFTTRHAQIVHSIMRC